MKRILMTLALLAALLPLAAFELTVSGMASNFAFDLDGKLNPENPVLGLSFGMTERINSTLSAGFNLDVDPIAGRSLGARVSYSTPFITISAGPFFGLLNSSGQDEEVLSLYRTGLGLGLTLTVPGILVAQADADFCLPADTGPSDRVDLQKSSLRLGFYLPNLLCSAGISQKSNTIVSAGTYMLRSQTDYGFYTEAFKKQSPWRVNVNFIWREIDYYTAPSAPENRKIANLVLGLGTNWSPSNEFAIFTDISAALYTLSLAEPVNGLEKFLYDFRIGVKLDLDRERELTPAPVSLEAAE